MDVKIDNGDIVTKACGDALYIDGMDEIMQRIKIACSVKKGTFIYDRNLGSEGYTVSFDDSMLKSKLEMLFKEASIDIPYSDLSVVRVDKVGEKLKVCIKITCGTESDTVEVTINGQL